MLVTRPAASQYMNYMNAFFTAQKMGVPVDTCMMDRESGLLQQGADITGGIYVKVPNLDSLFQVIPTYYHSYKCYTSLNFFFKIYIGYTYIQMPIFS